MGIRPKTTEEIKVLREGGKRLGAVLAELMEMVKPGVSTEEINERGEKRIQQGGDTPAFLHYTPAGAPRPYPAGVCVSINDEIVHGIPNEDPTILKEGDIVTIDLGLKHEGLITDSAATVAVGDISDDAAKLLSVTQEALMAGIKQARLGNHVGDISAAIEHVARGNNVSIFEELVGHGVGYAVHEPPYIPNVGKAGTGEELIENMVIAIEPMFGLGSSSITMHEDGYTYKTKDGSLSAHFEHTIAVLKNGPEILTKR